MVYAIARSDRRWQGYHFARSAAFWLSDGMLEVWIQVQINTWVSSLPAEPRPAAAMFSTFPHLDFQVRKKKQSSQSPEQTEEEGTRPPVLPQHLSSFTSFSLAFSLKVWHHISVLSSLSHLSPPFPSCFCAFCPYFHPFIFSLQINNKVNRQGDGHRKPVWCSGLNHRSTKRWNKMNSSKTATTEKR